MSSRLFWLILIALMIIATVITNFQKQKLIVEAVRASENLKP